MNFVGNDGESEPRKSFWIFVQMPKGDSLVYLFASIEQANDGAETAAIDRLVLSWSENIFSYCLRAPGYRLTLWCTLGLLVGGAIEVPQLLLLLLSGESKLERTETPFQASKNKKAFQGPKCQNFHGNAWFKSVPGPRNTRRSYIKGSRQESGASWYRAVLYTLPYMYPLPAVHYWSSQKIILCWVCHGWWELWPLMVKPK